MSLNEVDLKKLIVILFLNQTTSLLYLTKLLSDHSWYAAQMSSFPDIFEDVETFFLLTASSATPLMFEPSGVASYEPSVVSSSSAQPTPIPKVPDPSFQRNVEINVSDYHNLKMKPSGVISTIAASNDTPDVFTPKICPLSWT
jgi:hypothetical protein